MGPRLVGKLSGPARTVALSRLAELQGDDGHLVLLQLIEATVGLTPVSSLASDFEYILTKLRRR